jgi:hypothetical protein
MKKTTVPILFYEKGKIKKMLNLSGNLVGLSKKKFQKFPTRSRNG